MYFLEKSQSFKKESLCRFGVMLRKSQGGAPLVLIRSREILENILKIGFRLLIPNSTEKGDIIN